MTDRAMLLRVATAGALVAALAACSSSGTRSPASSTPSVPMSATPSARSTSPSSVAPTAAPSTSVPPPRTSPAPSSPAPTAPPATPTRTAAPVLRSTCTSIRVRVIRGGPAMGREFAALQFTNTGTSRCILRGYPVVTLLSGGKAIGSVSQPSGARTSQRSLAPGETAESQLNDYTGCQAPLSDTLRVQVPGSSQTGTGVARLRACTLRVDPLGAPD